MRDAIFWILDAPGETFGQHIKDVGGLRKSGRSWRPFWFDLGPKIYVHKEIADFSGIYALACMGAWFFNGLGEIFDGSGQFGVVSGTIWERLESFGCFWSEPFARFWGARNGKSNGRRGNHA